MSWFQCWLCGLGQITSLLYAPCFHIFKSGVFLAFSCEQWRGLNGCRSPVGPSSVSFSHPSSWLHSSANSQSHLYTRTRNITQEFHLSSGSLAFTLNPESKIYMGIFVDVQYYIIKELCCIPCRNLSSVYWVPPVGYCSLLGARFDWPLCYFVGLCVCVCVCVSVCLCVCVCEMRLDHSFSNNPWLMKLESIVPSWSIWLGVRTHILLRLPWPHCTLNNKSSK